MANKQSIVNRYISKMDFFSSPLQFTLGPKDKAKRTLFGGVLTILIIAVSFSYFIYLCTLYFSNKILPTISTASIQLENNFEINVSDDLYGYKIILESGQSLQEYESQMGKRYISYLAIYNYYEGQERKQAQFLMAPCKSEKLLGYICIDKKSLQNENFEKFQFKYINDSKPQNSMTIYFIKCSKKFLQQGEICETDDQLVNEILYSISTQVEIKNKLIKFNPLSKKYEEMSKIEHTFLDQDLLFETNFYYQTTQTRKTDGFIIQSTETENNLSDYQIIESPMSRSKVWNQLHAEIYIMIGFNLIPNLIIQSVQYEQFTTILAQFISVLQSLLVIGIICSSISQMEIVSDLLNLQLKVYYKKTALDILKQSDKSRATDYELLNQYQLLQSIQDSDLRTKIPNYTQLGFMERGKQKQQAGSIEVKTYKSLLQKSMKSLDIYHIQKQLLKLEMMVRLIFTAEQYAAIQMCGCSVLREDQNSKNGHQDGLTPQIQQSEQAEHTKLNVNEIANSMKNKKKQDAQKLLNHNQNNVNNDGKENNKISKSNEIKNIYPNLNGNNQNTTDNQTPNNTNNVNKNTNQDNTSSNKSQNNININSIQNNAIKSQNNNKVNNVSFNQDNNNDNSVKINNNSNNNVNNNLLNNNNLNPPKEVQNLNQPRVNDEIIQNHLETIELIEHDETILQQYINKYMNNNKVPQSELDQRIIQSMIGINNIKQQNQHKS